MAEGKVDGKLVCSKCVTDGNSVASRTFKIRSGGRLLIIGQTSNTDRCFAFSVIAFSGGAVYVQELAKGAGVSYDTSVANQLTITTSTSGNLEMMVFSIYKVDIEYFEIA